MQVAIEIPLKGHSRYLHRLRPRGHSWSLHHRSKCLRLFRLHRPLASGTADLYLHLVSGNECVYNPASLTCVAGEDGLEGGA